MYLSVFKANIYKYFVTLYRAYPRSFFIGGILSVFYALLFSFLLYDSVFDKQMSHSFVEFSNTNNYMAYVVIGVLVYQFTVSTLLNVSRSLITEKRLGTLESVLMAPYHRGMYFLSYMIAQTFHTFSELLFAIPFLFVFNVKFESFHFFSFIIVFMLALLSFLGLSMLLANVMLYTRDTYISQNTLFTIMFLVCGVNFPREYLPKWLQWVGEIIPVTYVIEMFRGILLNGKIIDDYIRESISLLIIGLLYLIIGMMLLKKVEKIAVEKIEG